MWYVIVFAVINSIPTLATTDGTYCEVKHTALVTEEDVYNHTANSPSLSAPKQHYYQLKPKHLSCLRLTKISSKECNHLEEAVPKLKTKPNKRSTFLKVQPPEHFKCKVPVYLQTGRWVVACPSNLFLPEMIQVVPPTSTPTHLHQ